MNKFKRLKNHYLKRLYKLYNRKHYCNKNFEDALY